MRGRSESRSWTVWAIIYGKPVRAWLIALPGRSLPKWIRRSSCCTASSRKRGKYRQTISLWRRNEENNICKTMSNRTHRGSDFRDFLKEQSVLEEVEARALKQVISLQLLKLLDQKSLTKAAMARRMRTSRAALDRLLDATNTSMTLTTLGKAARALGRKVKIELVPA